MIIDYNSFKGPLISGVPSLLDLGLRAAPRWLKSQRQRMHGMLSSHRVAFERLARGVLWFFGTDLIAAAGVRYTQESINMLSEVKSCSYI